MNWTHTLIAGLLTVSFCARVGALPQPPASKAATRAPGPQAIFLKSGVIDPGRVADKSAITTGHALVQFESRQQLNASALTALGAEVMDYVPNLAYLVRLNGTSAEALRAVAGVRFVGEFRDEYKVSPAIAALDQQGERRLAVYGFPGVSGDRLAKAITQAVPDAKVLTHQSLAGRGLVYVATPATRTAAVARALAELEGALWIETALAPELDNADSVGPIQANADSGGLPPTATPIWDQDITGSGQIVAVVDSGVDRNMNFFRMHDDGTAITDAYTDAQEAYAPGVGTLSPANKIVGYFVHDEASDPYDTGRGCSGGLGSFHGTHVSGSILGDRGTPASPTEPHYDDGDGMAPNAQLLVQDIGSTEGCLSPFIGFVTYQQARNAGAYISNHSYGAPVVDDDGEVDMDRLFYSGGEFQVDQFTFLNDDYLMVTSAGNDGPADATLSHPGHAKNALTVGANEHGNDPGVAGFSSRGPTFDGRIKPDIVAPGTSIRSAGGDQLDDLPPPGFGLDRVSTLSGTSMASPTTAGAAALARQYFIDGFYPSGARRADDALRPLGSLLKAVLLNGTRTYSDTPANNSGWGRVWLDNNLYFSGDDRQMRAWGLQNGAGMETGESHEYTVQVGAGEEFRATLVWYDPPGSLFTSGPVLVNDLDLVVEANGTTFRGNVFLGGRSNAGGSRDTLNTVEQVYLPNPEAGTYTIRVDADSAPGNGTQNTDRQGYALVVSAAQCDSAVGAAGPVSVGPGSTGVQIDFDAITGAGGYQVYRAQGSCASPASEFQFIGSSDTVSFEDNRTQGGFEYAYRVRGVDACGEGPVGGCASLVSTAACTLLPAFDAGSVKVDRTTGGSCGVEVTWDAGAAACPGTEIGYNLYRSTDPFFVPGPDNLVISGVTGDRFEDRSVDPLVTYYYAVKAEDSSGDGAGPRNGNESLQVARFPITTFADSSSPGTFADDPDQVSFVDRDPMWRISTRRASTGSFSYLHAEDFQDYSPDTCARLVTPPITLQSGAPQLSYDARFDLEVDWDGVIVEVSSDGGVSWQDLPPDGGYPGTLNMTEPTPGQPVNACGYPATQGAFTGRNTSFQTYTSDLSALAGQTVQIRFSFTSDPGVEEEGFYLDNLQVTEASSPDACTAGGVHAGMSGPWFNASQAGHGWLVEVLDSASGNAEAVNAYWYVYNNGAPVWLIGTGPVDGSSAVLDTFITDGGDFPPDFNGSDLIPWGTLTFDFASDTQGTASWQPVVSGFQAGSLDMVQLAPIAQGGDACRSGSYFNLEQSGHGFVAEVVEVEGVPTVVLAWYVYQDGDQVWLFGQGPLVDDTAVATMGQFSGADFPPDFDPSQVINTDWGTVTITFTGPDSATVSWTSNVAGFADGQLELTRLTRLLGHVCP